MVLLLALVGVPTGNQSQQVCILHFETAQSFAQDARKILPILETGVIQLIVIPTVSIAFRRRRFVTTAAVKTVPRVFSCAAKKRRKRK